MNHNLRYWEYETLSYTIMCIKQKSLGNIQIRLWKIKLFYAVINSCIFCIVLLFKRD